MDHDITELHTIYNPLLPKMIMTTGVIIWVQAIYDTLLSTMTDELQRPDHFTRC